MANTRAIKKQVENLMDRFMVGVGPSGDVWWVDSNNGSTAYTGKEKDRAVVTIDAAINLADSYDTIIVLPGHAETISGATSLVMDVVGIQIIGIGEGTARPRLTLSANLSTISVTVASTRLQNMWIICTKTSGGSAVAITVAAGGDGIVLRDIVMEETSADTEIVIGISIANLCHDVLIEDFKFFGTLGGGDVSAIDFVGASDRSVVRNCWLHGDWSASMIDGLQSASEGVLYENIHFYQDDAGAGLGIQESNTSTGLMVNCHGLNKKAGIQGCTGDLMGYSQCYSTNLVNLQGFLQPVADS